MIFFGYVDFVFTVEWLRCYLFMKIFMKNMVNTESAVIIELLTNEILIIFSKQ